MKKVLVFLYLLLIFSTVRAQYPAALPSSGAISVKAISDWMLVAGEITTGTYSISSLNSKSHLTDKTAPYSLSDWYGYMGGCGTNLVITHTAGAIAPVSKTVTYGIAKTTLSGATKCWITQNLGADHQATSYTDNTEASGGWFWQFNNPQGFNHDEGTTRTPSTIWNSSISESSDWIADKDPCALLLGTGWRIPTGTEWNTANAAWSGNYNNSYNSVLRLHTSGYIDNAGTFANRGYIGTFWSSTQADASNAAYLDIRVASDVFVPQYSKAFGFAVRCLKDISYPFTTCGNTFEVVHVVGSVAPVSKVVNYGTVLSSFSGASKCWITKNLGANNSPGSMNDATEAASGWYWQFNRKQGYRIADDGARTPSITWNTSFNENSDWAAINDPCTLLLGSGWRIPTQLEWTTVVGPPQNWTGTDPYTSVLKLHSAGFISTGPLNSRGGDFNYWSSTQYDNTNGWNMPFGATGNTGLFADRKDIGFAIRCLKD